MARKKKILISGTILFISFVGFTGLVKGQVAPPPDTLTVESVTALQGAMNEPVNINLINNSFEVEGFNFKVSFNADVLTVLGVQKTTRTQEFPTFSSLVIDGVNNVDTVSVVGTSFPNPPLEVDTGAIARILFAVSDTSSARVDSLTLSDQSAISSPGGIQQITPVLVDGTFTVVLNQPPVLATNDTLMVEEDSTKTITSNALQVTDADNSPDEIMFTVVAEPVNGALLLNGADSIKVTETFTQADIDSNKISYAHDGSESTADSFDFTVSDGAGGTIDTTIFNITVNPTNDAPVIVTNTGLTVDEDSTKTITSGDLEVTDVDNTPDELTFTIAAAPINGTLLLNGADSIKVNETFTQADIDNELVSYKHGGNETTNDSFNFTVSDSAGGMIDTTTFNIAINPVNDAPVIANNDTLMVDEDSTKTITSGDLEVTDADNVPDELVFTVVVEPINGTLILSSTALNIDSTFTQDDIDNNRLSYEHDGSETTTDSFKVTVSDGTGGTIDTTTFNIAINPVNDAPVLVTNNGLTVNEGGMATITSGELDVNDADNTPEEIMLTIAVAPINGTLLLNGADSINVNETFTQADINSNKISYAHDGTGTTTDSFDFTVSDGAGGTIDTTTFDITINPTNTAPVIAANNGLTVNEGDSATITDSELKVTDADNTPDEIVFRIVSAPTNGALMLDEADSITVNETFTQADIDSDRISYEHSGNETINDSFEFIVSDGSGGSIGNTTFIITVNPINDAPELTVPGTQTVDEDSVLTIPTISISDVDAGDSLLEVTAEANSGIFSLSQSDGLNFVNGAGTSKIIFSGMLSNLNSALSNSLIYQGNANFNGMDTITLTANDQGNTGEDPGLTGDEFSEEHIATIDVMVIPVNDPPVLSVPGTQTVSEGDSLGFSVSASDLDGTVPILTAVNLPANSDFDSLSGLFTFKPDFTQGGGIPFMVTFIATDADSSSLADSADVVMNVTDVDRPPILDPIGNQTVNEDTTITVPVSATDADMDSIELMVSNKPAFVTFADSGDGTGTLTISPGFNDAGSYPNIIVTALANGLSQSDTFSITVIDVNRLPAFVDRADTTIIEGQQLQFTVSASDPDGDNLVFDAPKKPQGSSFNTGTKLFNWTPSFTQAGVDTVIFTVSDGKGGTDADTVKITVTNVPQPPVLTSIPDQTMNETETRDVAISAVDPDGDSILLFANNLPGFAQFTVVDDTTANIRLTPGFNDSGFYPGIIVTALAGNQTDADTFNVTVNDVNRAPAFVSQADTTINEGQQLQFTINAIDPDNDVLTFSTLKTPAGASFNPNLRLFTWTPTFEQAGVDTAIFRVIDGRGGAANDTVQITVNDTNRNPTLNAIGNKSVSETDNLTFTVTAIDQDGDALSFGIINRPSGASYDSLNTRVFSWTPTFEQSGNFSVTFTVDDGRGGSDSETIIISVGDVNRPPTITVPGTQTVAEGDTLRFTVSASDADETVPILSAIGLPDNADFDSNSGAFTFMPDFTQSDSSPFNAVFRATDASDNNLFVSASVEITVTDVNRPPILPPIGDKSVNEGDTLSFTLAASDPDGDILVLNAKNLPTGANFNFTSGTFMWIPNFTQAGVYPGVRFEVSEVTAFGVRTIFEEITITVQNTNRAPELGPIGNRTATEGELVEITVSATDPDGDGLVFSASNLPDGASFSSAERKFSWVPNPDQAGVYLVRFEVRDDVPQGSLTDFEDVSISVGNVNRPPELNSIGNKATDENELLEFTVSATELDVGDVLTFSASNLPTGAKFDPGTQVFSWTPNFLQAGEYPGVRFEVRDTGLLSDFEEISISVNDVNRLPVFDELPDVTVNENEMVSFTVTASDLDSDNVLTFGTLVLPSGAAFDSTGSRLFSWTPAADQTGNFVASFKVEDGHGGADTTSVNISVTDVNQFPTISAISDTTIRENQLLQFTVIANDPDGDSLTFQVTSTPPAEGSSFDVGTRKFVWRPTFLQSGVYTINFSVNDGKGGSASTSVTVTVLNANAPPVLGEIGNKTVEEGKLLQFTVAATDADNDVLTFVINNRPQGSQINGSTGVFSWIPGANQEGVYANVRFTVTDGVASDFEEITITVLDANQPPVLASIGNKSVDENQRLQFQLSASDIDGDQLTFSGSNLPQGATLNSTTGLFSWTPGFDQAGTYTVNFSVSDGRGGSDSKSVQITVRDVNRRPELDLLGTQTVNEGIMLTFTRTATDPDGDGLTFSATNLPTGATFSNSVFNWVPNFSQAGNYNVTFFVSDGRGGSDSDVITIVVNDVDINPPEFTISILQNPILTNFVDVFVVSSEQLSDSPSATLNGDQLNFSTIPGNSIIYVADFTLTTSGIITLVLSGTDLAGNDTTLTEIFSVGFISASVGGSLTSYDSVLTVNVNSKAVSEDKYILSLPRSLKSDLTAYDPTLSLSGYTFDETRITETGDETGWSGIYIIEPKGMVLNSRAKLMFDYKKLDIQEHNSNKIAIYQLNDEGGWVYLQTFLDEQLGIVSSLVSRLGIFKVEIDSDGNSPVLPQAFSLSQNYPNPFNPSTTIHYTIPVPGDDEVGKEKLARINLSIYNVRGTLVKTLVDEHQLPGYYSVHWDGKDDLGERVSSGVYFYRISIDSDLSEVKKMMIVK